MSIVKCFKCENKWEIEGTPDYGRFVCNECVPSDDHYSIFDENNYRGNQLKDLKGDKL